MTLTTPSTRTSTVAGEELEVRSVHLDDPLVQPLLDDLAAEYLARYSSLLPREEILSEMDEYPASDFTAPHGDLLLLLEGSTPVAGGGFRRRTEPEIGDVSWSVAPHRARTDDGAPAVPTAELKRIWTSGAHRRRGLAKLVLAELERRAVACGYERLYLTTGPRQPEATALYLSVGFTALFDTTVPADTVGTLAFEKWLSPA